MERLIDGPLSRKPLSGNQKGRFTETALSTAVSLLKAHLETKGFAIGTLIDIKVDFNDTSGATFKAALEKV